MYENKIYATEIFRAFLKGHKSSAVNRFHSNLTMILKLTPLLSNLPNSFQLPDLNRIF